MPALFIVLYIYHKYLPSGPSLGKVAVPFMRRFERLYHNSTSKEPPWSRVMGTETIK